MAQLSNVPASDTYLRVEARKSFPLGVHIYDPNGAVVDLTGCTLRIVAKQPPINDDSDVSNILAPDDVANIPVPNGGYAIFNIQASTLDVTPGEYPFAIVLVSSDGISSVLVKGTLQVEQNTEWTSVNSIYSYANPTSSLSIYLREQQSINVSVGGTPPPGMNFVRDDVMETIETFDPDAIAYVPEGGSAGYVLTKINPDDYAMEWRPVGNGQFSLDATGIPSGWTPVAQGDGTWTWDEIGINADTAPEGWAPISNGDGTWSWAEVNQEKPDWNAIPGSDAEILNKPDLGTIAEDDKADYYASDTLVSAMEGIVFQTTIPTATVDNVGVIYFVYTP
jgi:hypothetical protein